MGSSAVVRGSAVGRTRGEQAANLGHQHIRIARLHEHGIEAALTSFIELRRMRVPGGRDEWNVAGLVVRAQRPRDIEAGKTGHLEVHDDEIGTRVSGAGKGLVAVGGRQHREARGAEVQLPHVEGVRVVVHDENGVGIHHWRLWNLDSVNDGNLSLPPSFIKVRASVMTDTDRVLDLLIHDLRTPLGVAHGYLRLVRERRLPSPHDAEHALAEAQRALTRMGELCEAASAFLSDGAEQPLEPVDANQLVRRVNARLRTSGIRVDAAELDSGQTMRIGANLDRLADAVVTLLSATSRTGAAESVTVSIEADRAELRFTARADAPSLSAPFDPWRGYGLAMPLACKLIADAGGAWRAGGDPGVVSAAFPLETTPV
jgi:signal transduction histidine kinase